MGLHIEAFNIGITIYMYLNNYTSMSRDDYILWNVNQQEYYINIKSIYAGNAIEKRPTQASGDDGSLPFHVVPSRKTAPAISRDQDAIVASGKASG